MSIRVGGISHVFGNLRVVEASLMPSSFLAEFFSLTDLALWSQYAWGESCTKCHNKGAPRRVPYLKQPMKLLGSKRLGRTAGQRTRSDCTN